jgi:DNA-binding NtrC family response regulator
MASKAIAIIDDEADLVDLFQEALEKNGLKFLPLLIQYKHSRL